MSLAERQVLARGHSVRQTELETRKLSVLKTSKIYLYQLRSSFFFSLTGKTYGTEA